MAFAVMLLGVLIGQLFFSLPEHEPAPGILVHHAVVISVGPIESGWSLLCEPEVGGHVLVANEGYLQPGTTVYISVVGGAWHVVPRPE